MWIFGSTAITLNTICRIRIFFLPFAYWDAIGYGISSHICCSNAKDKASTVRKSELKTKEPNAVMCWKFERETESSDNVWSKKKHTHIPVRQLYSIRGTNIKLKSYIFWKATAKCRTRRIHFYILWHYKCEVLFFSFIWYFIFVFYSFDFCAFCSLVFWEFSILFAFRINFRFFLWNL